MTADDQPSSASVSTKPLSASALTEPLSALDSTEPLSASALSSPKIKICGICNIEDAQLAVKYGASYIGLVFVKSGPRYIEPMLAKSIAEAVGKDIQIVGVFQNSTLEEMENIASLVGLDYFQLHGQETSSLCSTLSKPVIKVFQLASKPADNEACITLPLLDLQSKENMPNAEADLSLEVKDLSKESDTKAAAIENCLGILETYKPYCQHFLFDRPKKNANHDWLRSASQALSLIEEHLQDYFLAGNLNAKNIQGVLATLKPAVVDVASGVEKIPRQKSETLIADFCAAVRFAQQCSNKIISSV